MKKVLIVDDEKDILVLLSKFFERLNFEADSAQDGKEALAKIKENQYDLVVLDNQMPVMTGEQFLEEIYTTKKKDFKIILTSGRTLNLFKLLNKGQYFTIVDYVLNKPYKFNDIKEIMEELELS